MEEFATVSSRSLNLCSGFLQVVEDTVDVCGNSHNRLSAENGLIRLFLF